MSKIVKKRVVFVLSACSCLRLCYFDDTPNYYKNPANLNIGINFRHHVVSYKHQGPTAGPDR